MFSPMVKRCSRFLSRNVMGLCTWFYFRMSEHGQNVLLSRVLWVCAQAGQGCRTAASTELEKYFNQKQNMAMKSKTWQ